MEHKTTCGIYALKENNNIYYVGNSKRIEIRVRQHKQHKKGLIDYEILEVCKEIHLYRRERHWIKYLIGKGVILINKQCAVNRYLPKKYFKSNMA